MNKKFFCLLICFLLLFSVFCGCNEKKEDNSDKKEDKSDDIIVNDYNITTLNSRFGFMHPDDFADMTDMGVFWQRPHPGPFIWGRIETSPGVYNWGSCDEEVKRSQKYGVNIIATIWPFADWDQSSCHTILSGVDLIFDELGNYRGKPCDMESYTGFISKLVERYDGDGVDDMDGLVVPIKYWEVSNEPSMQHDFHTFFVGSAQDYFDILNATYQGVKNVDSDAVVVQGGMAGVIDDHVEFWTDVIGLGGNSFFDIANIHSINSESDSVNAFEFKQFLDDQGVDKPFWVTEVELGSMDKTGNGEDMGDSLVTNFVLAFHSGAEKIFHPGIMKKAGKNELGKEDTYNALMTIISKIDYFISVEKLDEGQYKFILEDETVYVLWGEGSIPVEITGQIKKTDVSGQETIINSDDLVLSKSPIYVEI
jgi:hypothetical protein